MKNITDQARLKKMEASQADELRQQAEAFYRQQNPEQPLPKTASDLQRLVYELGVHQIELEMQNEELRQTQLDLETVSSRYVDLFDFAPVGYLTLSELGIILKANFKAAKMLGEVRSHLVNRRLTKFIFPADQDIVNLHRQTLFAGGIPQASELRMVKNDGSVIWVYMEADLVQDVERSVLAYQITLNDITLRKQAEEALRQSEERYRLLADDAPLATLVSDLQTGEVLYTNRRAAELFEIPIDQLLKAKTPELYANPQERERILTLLNAHGQVKDFEVCLRKGDGREFWISINLNKTIFNGRPAVHTTCIDISRRKQTEEELRESHAKLELLFDLLPVGISVLNPQRKIVKLNPALESILGINQEGLLRGDYRKRRYFNPDGSPMSPAEYASSRIIAGEAQALHVETGVEKEDGTLVWTDVSAAATPFSDWSTVIVTTDISQRKQAEEALRTSEQHFRTLFEQAAVGVALTETKTGRYVRINQKYCDFLGYTQEDMLSMRFQDITYPEDTLLNEKNNVLLMAGEIKEYSTEKRYVRKDGTIIWGRLTASPMWLPGETPEVYTHIAVVEDITERKRAEEALRTSEEHFRTLFEQAAVGVALLETKTGRYVRINQKYCDFLGYTLEEMLQLRFQDVTYPEDTQTNVDYNSLLIEGKLREFEIEKRYLRKDGQKVWGILSASPLWMPGEVPQVYYHIAVVQDISERKKAEEELRESEERLHAVFSTIQDAIFVFDHQYRLVTFNQAYQNALRSSGGKEMAAGDPILAPQYPPQFLQTWKNNYDRAFSGETFMVESNVEMLDGMHILENTLTPMLDAQKNVNGVLVVSHDVTEQRKAEAELIESQKMVGIGTLAAGIAHEINSPLQVITGYSDSLLKELQVAARLEGERPERQLKTINRNAWRVAEIVRSLQHYAYPNTDRASQTELNELVKDTLILIEHQLKSWSNIAVETRLAADLPPFMCDPNKIIQVLINLLSNARDAMPMGGTIKIETAYQADPERLVLTIADDGDGIPEAVRKRIFDPFFTTKIVGKGTGLGLSIVQGIVRAHGGEIQVESVLKAGTTFTISLPLIMPVQESGGDAENLTEEAARARYD